MFKEVVKAAHRLKKCVPSQGRDESFIIWRCCMNSLSICREILQKISELIHSESFLESHRVKNRFIRKGLLTMTHIIVYLLYTSKQSMSINLSNIQLELPELKFPKVTKQAVSKARQGILPSLFKELFDISVDIYYNSIDHRKKWRGLYHIFAVDGSRINLPVSKSNFKNYGEMFSLMNPNRKWSMALGSTIYDVCNDVIVHGLLKRYLGLPGNKKKGTEDIPIRVISVPLDGGETEYLATTIFDESLTSDDFKELYFMRWPIESKYEELKNQFLLEEFSGATSTSIEQEFYINLLLSNLSALVKCAAYQKIESHKKEKNRYRYQANRAYIIGRRKMFIARFLASTCSLSLLDNIFEGACANRSQIQPGRRDPRKKKADARDRKHFNNRKFVL